MKIEMQHDKLMECSISSSKREAHSNKCYFNKQEKYQIDKLTLHHKEQEK